MIINNSLYLYKTSFPGTFKGNNSNRLEYKKNLPVLVNNSDNLHKTTTPVIKDLFCSSKAKFKKYIDSMTIIDGWGEKRERFTEWEKEGLLKIYNKDRRLMLFLVNQQTKGSNTIRNGRFTGFSIVDLFNTAKQSKENEKLLKEYMQKTTNYNGREIYRFTGPELNFLVEESAKSKENKDLIKLIVDDTSDDPHSKNMYIKDKIPTYDFGEIKSIVKYAQKDERMFDIINMRNKTDKECCNKKNIITGILHNTVPVTVPFIGKNIAKENNLEEYTLSFDERRNSHNNFNIESYDISTSDMTFTSIDFNSDGNILQKNKNTYKFPPFQKINSFSRTPDNITEISYSYKNNSTNLTDLITTKEVKDKNNNIILKEYRTPSKDIKGKFDISTKDKNGHSELISFAEKSKSGINIIEKNFNHDDGSKTNYVYAENSGKERFTYIKITNSDNKILLENKQKFKIIDDNHFESEENGTKYDIRYFDDKVVCTNNYDKKVTISIGDKGIIDKNIIPLVKQIPGSMYFKIADCNIRKIGKNIDNEVDLSSHFNHTTKTLNICEEDPSNPEDLFTVLHELGHAIDGKSNITSHSELHDIYLEEREKFLNKETPDEYEDMEYLLKFKNKSLDKSLSEMVAETNAYLYTTNNDSSIERRGELLQQHFPKSFAKIAQLLNADNCTNSIIDKH